jgi:hypothetical protein
VYVEDLVPSKRLHRVAQSPLRLKSHQGAVDSILSDALLCKLTWADRSCLVVNLIEPKMSRLGLKFDNEAFEDFLDSNMDRFALFK